MRFSIIINTHNQIRFIKDCINSCINQDFYDYEIIVHKEAELVKMGYSEEQAASIYYSQVGTPIKKPDEGSEINWTSIQKPNQIEAFAGRRFIWSPEAAQQYSENHQKNVN